MPKKEKVKGEDTVSISSVRDVEQREPRVAGANYGKRIIELLGDGKAHTAQYIADKLGVKKVNYVHGYLNRLVKGEKISVARPKSQAKTFYYIE